MTQQDKDLLLRDLCARLPYRVMVQTPCSESSELLSIDKDNPNYDAVISVKILTCSKNYTTITQVKPYLRPLSSLTQEERNKFCDIGGVISYRPSDGKQYIVAYIPEALDYLNSIHVDYRGLIEKGLAIEVTDENNPYK